MAKISQKKARRRTLLSSLSGAAAAVLVAGSEAKADIVVVPVNQTFTSANEASATFTLPGQSEFTVAVGKSSFYHFINVASTQKAASAYFRVKGYRTGFNSTNGFHLLDHFGAGAKWSTAAGHAESVGGISIISPFGSQFGKGLFNNEYFLFEFKDTSVAGDPMRYGWISGSFTDNSYSGITYNMTAYAYDTSGAEIPAGAMSSVPEPSSMVLAGVAGALVLGAAGVRRWKEAVRSPEAGAAR